MLRIVLEIGAIYTLVRWSILYCQSASRRMYWISNIAILVVLTLLMFCIVLPIGYEFDLSHIAFETPISTAWLVVDTLEVSSFFTLFEYFDRQVKRRE